MAYHFIIQRLAWPCFLLKMLGFFSVVPRASLSWCFAEFDSSHSNGCSTLKQKITWFRPLQPSSFQKFSDTWLWRKYNIWMNSLTSFNLSSAEWFSKEKKISIAADKSMWKLDFSCLQSSDCLKTFCKRFTQSNKCTNFFFFFFFGGLGGGSWKILQFTFQIKTATCHYITVETDRSFSHWLWLHFPCMLDFSNARGLDCTQEEYLFVAFLWDKNPELEWESPLATWCIHWINKDKTLMEDWNKWASW